MHLVGQIYMQFNSLDIGRACGDRTHDKRIKSCYNLLILKLFTRPPSLSLADARQNCHVLVSHLAIACLLNQKVLLM
jgi:hypothetical protein